MKKILFLLVALVCSMSISAQTMMVKKNGELVARFYGAEYSVTFEEGSNTGTVKRTGDIDVKWVQLWENGPKFAEYNVGAANNKAEDYGGYYCWGRSIDTDPQGAYKSGADVLTGDDDTATKLWGSAWRMPTQREFQALIDKCNSEYTTVNGVYGRKFTGKGDFASNSVFFPFAGVCYRTNFFDQGSYGNYWSSTPYYTSMAYVLQVSAGNFSSLNRESREYSYPVRAVLAETAIGIGTAKRTGNIDVNWVQLWVNGPKFAEYNVGAANNKAEDYGGYYCWGGSIDKDPNAGFNNGSVDLTGDEDTATKLWGSAWRMPTQAEFQALFDNCDFEWTIVNGVYGRKFTGKGVYASNSVFLPAAGDCYRGSVSNQGKYAYYWTSTLANAMNAYLMYFFHVNSYSTHGVMGLGRDHSYSVRAVLADECKPETLFTQEHQ